MMRRESLLEVELLPALSLAGERWCQKHPITHGNQGSVEPLWLSSLCVQITDKLVREMQWPVELPLFCAMDGREGSCREKPWQ